MATIKPSKNDGIDTTDSNIRIIKYGDSDLTSKRRKRDNDDVVDDPLLKNVDDDYMKFNLKSMETNLNSTLINNDTTTKNPDYIGGLLKDHQMPINEQQSSLNLLCAKNEKTFITNTPSNTSYGFENTFRILEKQVRTNDNKRKKYLQRISEEYIPSLQSLMYDNTNILNNSNQSMNSINNYDSNNSIAADVTTTSSASSSSTIEDASSNFFELELEAMQRIKTHLEQTKPDIFQRLNDSNSSSNTITSPINELLYDFQSIGLKNNTTDDDNLNLINDKNYVINNDNGDPEYVYHIAKGNDGRIYLRVCRSLLIDKVLCGNRVSQMTRTYDDIEAVTRLLEEKEKDLELTVQIGKELLQQNNNLENRIAELETELKESNDDRSQLLHDLHQKNELISVLTNDVDDGSENDTPTYSKSITLELLQKKISHLQNENVSLKQEASQLAKETDEVEEKERKLMEDITSQINSANTQFDGVSLELERHKEENRLQHEQIISLTRRLSDAEMRLHQLTAENDEQISLLSITKETQNMLTTELAEFKTRYQEVLSLLQEAQEQLRKYRKKSQPQARSSFISGLGVPQYESLHSELMESSLYSDNSLDSGISTDRMSGVVPSGLGGIGVAGNSPMPPYKKIFETVRCATKNGHYSDSGMSQMGTMSMSSSQSQPRMSTMPYMPPGQGGGCTSSIYSGSTYPSYESSSSGMGIKTFSIESLTSQSDDGYPTAPTTGVPGTPGAKDLEAALKRLTPGEVLARRAMLSHAPIGTYTYDENPLQMPLGIRTPDSIMSTGSISRLSSANILTNQWRLPEKLQIVKPMEGSQTLHHWSRLATPTLSGLLEERPGVTIRGGRGLEELGMQVYSLSDVEEDVEDYPGKQFQQSGCVYTFTNSTVMHPDDGTLAFSLSQSQLSSRMASNSTSRQPSCPPTPRAGLSRRNSCSTFSVNMGLASMLNERGIKAVTPSAINTPAGPNYSPTVTPCNSPEGSPTRSMSPEPLFGILSSGADLIRRKLIGDVERSTIRTTPSKQQKIMLSRLEKRALRSLRLLEKVESVGLENIIALQPNVINQLASGIASRSASPMAQLTSFKNLHNNISGSCESNKSSSGNSSISGSSSGLDDVQFNREQIRAVLSKGLSNDSLKSLIDNDIPNSQILSSDEDYDNNDKNSSSPYKHHRAAQATTSSSSSSTTSLETTAQMPENVTPITDIRIRQMQRQKSRRNLKNGIGGQRPDLGTVSGNGCGRVRPDLGKVINTNSSRNHLQDNIEKRTNDDAPTQSMTQSFVGSISSLFFGRKGGWL